MAEVKSKFKNLFRHNKQVIKENETAPNKGPSGPNIMSKPPTFTELFSHSLPYLVNESMAFNKNGVLLEQFDGNQLLRLSLGRDGYSTIWQQPRPHDVRYYNDKILLDDGTIIMKEGVSGKTVLYDQDLQHKTTHESHYGTLCGVLTQSPSVMYLRDNRISFYNMKTHHRVRTLSDSVKGGISIAQHSSGHLAVTDGWAHSLHIYTPDFDLDRKLELSFQARWRNGVVVVKDYIVIAQCILGILNVYSWEGDLLGKKSIDGQIYGVGKGIEETLQVLVCGNGEARLVVYKLS